MRPAKAIQLGFYALQIWLIFIFAWQPKQTHATDLLLQHSSRPLQAESTIDSLLPWETPIDGFFIRTHHPVPAIDNETISGWRLKIDGLVERELNLSISDLEKMKQHAYHAVLQCSGNRRGQQQPSVAGVQWKKGAVGNAQWDGVLLSELLEKAGIQKKGKYLRLEGADEPALPEVPKFIRSIPIEKVSKIPAMIALRMNREPIPVIHGGPTRLVLPGWYGQNWIKWIRKITITENEDTGFYMKKGYRVSGAPIEELSVHSLIVSPKEGIPLFPGKVRILGKAFSGAGSIKKVEISTDGGENWKLATLDPPHSDGGWQEFSYELTVNHPGKIELISRATDERNNTQPLLSKWNPGGYLKNEADRVAFEVTRHFSTSALSLLKQRCQTCHALELVTNQRLTSTQWEATIKKMEGFGLKIGDSERKTILQALSNWAPTLPKAAPTPIAFTNVDPSFWSDPKNKGNAKRGSEIYKKDCAACHGQNAEGLVGPNIKKRFMSPSHFSNFIKTGTEIMPSFAAKLSDQQIWDIQVFLLEVLD